MISQLHCTNGSLVLSGKVAYVPQVPFVMNDSVMGNITFGLEFDAIKYD